jgi:uncharacterized protein (DUF1330 family)
MNKPALAFAALAVFAAGMAAAPLAQELAGRAFAQAPRASLPQPMVDKPAGYLPLALPEKCEKPVFMVVSYWRSENGGMQEYGVELRNRKLYETLKGWYIARRPVEIFEGTWDANRMFLVAQFPCREAARAFYYSKEYQEIIPYRAGATDNLTITVHEVEPSPYR